jgi:TolB protein
MIPVDHLQIVCNGKIARELELSADHKRAYLEGSLPIESTGWCILRAFSDKAEYPILDLYPYATTSPVYVNVADAPLRGAPDAAFFLAWMDRLTGVAKSSTAWNAEAEKQSVLAIFEKARQKYEDIAKPKQ